MNIRMKTLVTLVVALMAIIPLNSSAQPLNSGAGCLLNGVEVPGDPELIEGTGGADVIDCSGSPTRHDIYGNNGNDTIIGSDFDDFIAGGGKNDTIYGGGGDDAIDGGAKDDTIYGEGGNDVIFGGVGSSPASGVGCELQTASVGSSFLAKGGSGDDTLNALVLRGADFWRFRFWAKGGSGDDTIYGGDGNDCINAGSGEDIVYGGAGNDTILGGNHADWLNGGLDDDWLDGDGSKPDTCIGGGGNDIFVDCEVEQ